MPTFLHQAQLRCLTIAVVICAAVTIAGAACHENVPPDDATARFPGGAYLIENVRLLSGETVAVAIADGAIVGVHAEPPASTTTTTARVDAEGRYIVPGLIDSHVHFRFREGATGFAAAGFIAAVDLAAPISFLEESKDLPLTVLNAGPMVTPVGGYPTQSWGRNGYGFQVADPAAATAAVDRLVDGGAFVIKIPLDGDRGLDDARAQAVVEAAHARGRKVVAHALTDAGARRAAALGVDALAHAPTEPLADATVQAWGGGVVISTLSAFGNSGAENLERLRLAGATILYGTDFGNSSTVGVSSREIAFMAGAGFSSAEIVAAMTSAPAAFWGLETAGEIKAGSEATFLLLDDNPREDALALLRYAHVVRKGASVR